MVPTIRNYEQMGLLVAPERTEGSQRRFDVAGLERLSFIKHARDLGFPGDVTVKVHRKTVTCSGPSLIISFAITNTNSKGRPWRKRGETR